jgi:hypothetical protein
MKLVVIESPYRGNTSWNTAANVEYAREAMHDSLARGEAPFASHLLYTQDGILNDAVFEDRELGMRAGLCWASRADLTVVYADRGISDGMAAGMADAQRVGRPVEMRFIRKREVVAE